MSALKSTMLIVVATCCFVTCAGAQSNCSDSGGNGRKRAAKVQHYGHANQHRYQHNHVYSHGYGHNYVARYTHYSAALLHGKADLIRSRGAANLLNAQAATQAEEARTRDLENDVFELNTRLERRRINSETRFGHLRAIAAERKTLQTHLVSVGAVGAKRLVLTELDPTTGQLQWPLLLQSRHFAKARRPVDGLFAVRAKRGSIHPDDYIPFRNWIERIKGELKNHIDTLPKEDYAVAQDFLRRIIVEVRLPVEPGLDAAFLVSK